MHRSRTRTHARQPHPDPPRGLHASGRRTPRLAAAAASPDQRTCDAPSTRRPVLDAITTCSTTSTRPDTTRSWLLLSLVDRHRPRRHRRRLGHRSAGLPRHQRRGLRRLDHAARRTSRRARLSVCARPVRPGFRLHRGRSRTAGVRRRGGGLPDRLRAVRVQGRVLLEDDRGDGRRRDRAALSGAATGAASNSSSSIASTRFISTSNGRPSTRSRWAGRYDSPTASTHYEPLITGRGLPVFPDAPARRADPGQATGSTILESHFGNRDDVETRVLRRGIDFDHVVLAVSLGMLPIVARNSSKTGPNGVT